MDLLLTLSLESYISEMKILKSISKISGLDPRNLRKGIDRSLSTGESLSALMEGKILGAQIELSLVNEINLHSFAPTILSWRKDLSVLEGNVKSIIRCVNVNEEILYFERAMVPVINFVESKIGLGIKTKLNAKSAWEIQLAEFPNERTLALQTGNSCHSLVMLWDDMVLEFKKKSLEQDDYESFSFWDFDIFGIITVFDAAIQAWDFYNDVAKALEELMVKEPEPQSLLAYRDWQVIQMNLASVASYVRGWMNIGPTLLDFADENSRGAQFKQQTQRKLERLQAISESPVPFDELLDLITRRQPRHLLSAWNVAYLAVESGSRSAVEQAEKQLAEITGLERDEVWSYKIDNEPALNEEPHIKEYFTEDGIPKILRRST